VIANPWTLKVEFSRGCNLACKFCPIYADPAEYEVKRFLELALLDAFLQDYVRMVPKPRVELALRGEPTLNPKVEELLSTFRHRAPMSQVSMFSNGVRILREPELLIRLFESGVNILNIDCYNGTYDRFKELVARVTAGTDIQLKDFRDFSAYQRHPNGEKLAVVSLVPDVADPARLVKVRVLHNMAGNSDPKTMLDKFGVEQLTEPLDKGCARPFREFILYYDGTVVLCCHDWKEEYVLGKFPEQSVRDIWFGERHAAALRAIYVKDRSGPPCARCDYNGGFRLGLLKDPRSA
jgi:MoaA/NifB/PqqE/SkfB family radical SAM enzyme